MVGKSNFNENPVVSPDLDSDLDFDLGFVNVDSYADDTTISVAGQSVSEIEKSLLGNVLIYRDGCKQTD